MLNILDTAGYEKGDPMRDLFMKSTR
uniref:Uncharacterized protein n=1 Tax=Arcella intermedia TaxID=1963864 RepID=A0A6B2LWU9_9EUKA